MIKNFDTFFKELIRRFQSESRLQNHSTPALSWPPEYELKRHRLARGVKLRAIPNRGLVITVPPRFNIRNIPSILDENKAWIEKHLRQIKFTKIESALPTEIICHAINKKIMVYYQASDTPLRLRMQGEEHILIEGDITNESRCRKILLRWIKRSSEIYLAERLFQISQRIGLQYSSLRIRGQKTVWGTCSATQLITLNFKLFLLPPALGDYIIIHELCHTRHMNHSARFWKLVEKFDPQWKKHRKELRNVDTYLPNWICIT